MGCFWIKPKIRLCNCMCFERTKQPEALSQDWRWIWIGQAYHHDVRIQSCAYLSIKSASSNIDGLMPIVTFSHFRFSLSCTSFSLNAYFSSVVLELHQAGKHLNPTKEKKEGRGVQLQRCESACERESITINPNDVARQWPRVQKFRQSQQNLRLFSRRAV